MKLKKIPNDGSLPVIGFGSWEVGGYSEPDYSDDAAIVRAFRLAIDMGYTLIDTAEMYGGGHTEELVGQAIQEANRESLFITSKVWKSNLHYEDVFKALDGSLRRLGTDYLDLYLIHWPNQDIPLEETFDALNELVAQGKVAHLGVSNFDLPLLKQAQRLSETFLVTDQVPYSLYHREYARNGVLEYCQENNILLTAYTPVEKGRVSKDPTLQRMAQKYGATPVQVALSWLVSQPKVIAIPRSTNPDHLRENLQAADLELAPEDIQVLNGLRA